MMYTLAQPRVVERAHIEVGLRRSRHLRGVFAMSGCWRCGRPEDHAIHGLVSKEGFHDFVRKPKKVYLGDAVYYEYDGISVNLTTENGFRATNKIVLDPGVIQALLRALGADFDREKLKRLIDG